MTDPADLKHRLDCVYRDRNLLAIAFAAMWHSNGGRAGYYYDPDDEYDGWPVVWVAPPGRTPAGEQMGWHVPSSYIPLLDRTPIPNEGVRYDGHSRVDRNNRLVEQLINHTGRSP